MDIEEEKASIEALGRRDDGQIVEGIESHAVGIETANRGRFEADLDVATAARVGEDAAKAHLADEAVEREAVGSMDGEHLEDVGGEARRQRVERTGDGVGHGSIEEEGGRGAMVGDDDGVGEIAELSVGDGHIDLEGDTVVDVYDGEGLLAAGDREEKDSGEAEEKRVAHGHFYL